MSHLALIVDDNPVNLALLHHVMVGAGFEALTASDGASMRVALAQRTPAVILMDLQLPGVDGLTLTRQLKSDVATQHICIVAVTSYAFADDQRRARAAGCDGYVVKPIDTRTIAHVVLECMAGRFDWQTAQS